MNKDTVSVRIGRKYLKIVEDIRHNDQLHFRSNTQVIEIAIDEFSKRE